MNNFESFIKTFCADVVAYSSVGDLLYDKKVVLVSPKIKLKKNEYGEEGIAAVVSQEAEYISGYCDREDSNIKKAEYVCFGDHSEHIKYVPFAFVQGADGLKILRPDTETFVPKYFYYALLNFYKRHDTYERHFKYVKETEIPIPSKTAQSQIVEILDKFVELNEALSDELELRRSQYKYVATKLFENCDTWENITSVCDVEKGKTAIQKAVPGEYPMVVTTSERKTCNSYQFEKASVCIPLVSSRGHGVASLNHVYYQEGKFALGNILCAVTPKNEDIINARYLYYYFERTKDYTLVPLMKGGANVSMHISDIEKLRIPVPSLAAQMKIVKILDTFEKICNQEQSGIMGEIALRRKQYEYYRDVLMRLKREDDAI